MSDNTERYIDAQRNANALTEEFASLAGVTTNEGIARRDAVGRKAVKARDEADDLFDALTADERVAVHGARA